MRSTAGPQRTLVGWGGTWRYLAVRCDRVAASSTGTGTRAAVSVGRRAGDLDPRPQQLELKSESDRPESPDTPDKSESRCRPGHVHALMRRSACCQSQLQPRPWTQSNAAAQCTMRLRLGDSGQVCQGPGVQGSKPPKSLQRWCTHCSVTSLREASPIRGARRSRHCVSCHTLPTDWSSFVAFVCSLR